MSIKTILKRWTDTSLMLRILVGLVIGAVFGLIVPQWTFLDIPGQVFVSALKGIAPVLVAVLVSASIAKAGGGLGPRFKIVISRYMLSTFIAALLAVVGSFLFPITLNLSEAVNGSAPKSLADVFMNLLISMVENPVKAVANANYIGILFWSIIVGISLKLVANGKTISVVQDFADVITLAVKWIIQFAPFGIFGLVFSSVAENGLDIFTTYGHLLLLLVGCMLANTMISNPFISFLMLKKNPYPLLFTCLKESGLNAFFTRSSAANIPINMALCKKLGLDEDFYSVSIPLDGHRCDFWSRLVPLCDCHFGSMWLFWRGWRFAVADPHGLLVLWCQQRYSDAGCWRRFHHRCGSGLCRDRPQLKWRRLLHSHSRILRTDETEEIDLIHILCYTFCEIRKTTYSISDVFLSRWMERLYQKTRAKDKERMCRIGTHPL